MGTLVVMRRELVGRLRSLSTAVLAAAVLAVDGILFNTMVLTDGPTLSAVVVERFFWCTSGPLLAVAVFLAMGLFAEERRAGTLLALEASPLAEREVVAGKFFAAWILLVGIHLATVYMPLLILSRGKISWGQVAAGYLGLALLGAAAVALGLLASALAPSPWVAAMGGSALTTILLVLWLLARVASPPLDEVVAYLSLHDRHFRPFMRGIISTQDVLYYLSLTYLALLTATRALAMRRARP